MKTLAAAIALLALPLAAQQPEDPKFIRKTYTIQRVAGEIKVDGVIDPAEWQHAQPMELPWETFPKNNEPAPVKTEAFLGYDDNKLYVAIRAYDPNPAAIRAHLTDRDNAYSDDFVGVVFDTFNDERRAFEFFSNPLGVQMDLTNNDLSGNEDDSWDAIWSSAGKIHADRYEIEMAIPFSQLRFKQSDAPQTWGLDILRIHPRDQRRRYGLHAQNKSRSCYVCQFSKLTGLTGITPGRNIEISPTVTSRRTDERRDLTKPFVSGSIDTEPGVTARWGITPSVTLLGTVNPDFSQIEADSQQLAINTAFALSFTEKRPFFLEGADFFESPLNVVYTRTIRDPEWGAKLTGKEGKSGGGFFVAQDAVTNLILPGAQLSNSLTLDQTNLTGVLRYRYDVGKSSNLGVLATTREGDDYSNRVVGVDGKYRLGQSDTIIAQLLTSRTEYPEGIGRTFDMTGTLSGQALRAEYRHSTREWFWRANYENVGTDFRADAGFMPRVDYTFALGALERIWWPKEGEKRWWSRWFWGADYDHTGQKSNGETLEEEVETWFGFAGPMQSYMSLDIGRRNRHFQRFDNDGEQFYNFYTELTPYKQLFAYLEINGGDTIDFTNIQAAKRLRIAPHVRYRASRNLDLRVTHQRERLDVDGGRLFTARLTELRAVYQFNIRMFVRAIVQHAHITRDPKLYFRRPGIAAENKQLDPSLLFSYKLNPQTVLFVGYSSASAGDDRVDLTERDRTLFVKVGYAWAM